jgi:hypothetical protein
MRLLRDAAGISRIFLIVLLVIAFIFGALFSYIYTMGYYAPFEFLLPDKPVFAIQSAEFSKQDTSFFDVTVINPSYSQSGVNITGIEARTNDDNRIHTVTSTVPEMPLVLPRGQSQTFRLTGTGPTTRCSMRMTFWGRAILICGGVFKVTAFHKMTGSKPNETP